MLTEVTSLADFFKKAETNDLYKTAAVHAHRASGDYFYNGNWKDAERWINKWVKDYVKPDGSTTTFRYTCKDMTDYLNTYIKRIC